MCRLLRRCVRPRSWTRNPIALRTREIERQVAQHCGRPGSGVESQDGIEVRGGGRVLVVGESARAHVVFHGRAAAALGVYLRDVRRRLVVSPHEPALFLTAWWGRRLSEVSLSFLLRRHAQAAGIAKIHPHALRHACATHLLKGGADVRHVQAILGHKKLETTALYTRVVIEDLRQVVSRAHPRERAWPCKARRYNGA